MNTMQLQEKASLTNWMLGRYKQDADAMKRDAINPSHYKAHPSGIECIQITEHFGFCVGNAMKYLWRADLKHDAIEDLEKAKWYIEREIAKRRESSGAN